MRGVFLAQLAVGVLGVMVVTGEYTTGMIRASLAAAPKRLPVLWAKALVFTVVGLDRHDDHRVRLLLPRRRRSSPRSTWTRPCPTPACCGRSSATGLYLTVVGLLGVALGAFIRSTAGAIAALFGDAAGAAGPRRGPDLTSWGDHINPYLPSNAGQQIMALTTTSPDMKPWPGFLLFFGYAVVAMAAAAFLLKRRDA